MIDEPNNIVPLWTLATDEIGRAPVSFDADGITADRLTELRGVLAVLAEAPIATLEAHPAPAEIDESRGIALDVASPLAQQLSQLVASGVKSVPRSGSGEVLYRMVVPAKVAASMGASVRSMSSSSVSGGIHSALVGKSGIVSQASFVPVAGTAGAVGGAVTAGTVVTVAAPLVLMAVAVGLSARAEMQRQAQLQRIEDLLKKADRDRLEAERNQLDGCRYAIDKATAILLDEGRIGASLGLDSAVHAIDTAVSTAERRLAQWDRALDSLPEGSVALKALRTAIQEVDDPDGEFAIQLEIAELAVALKRRVILLQAVEHAQLEGGNPFENFVRTLKADQRSVDQLDRGIARVLGRLSRFRLDRSRGVRDFAFSAGAVDELMNAAQHLRELGDRVPVAGVRESDVAIEILGHADGSVVVLPAIAV